ncbi:MAG: hypothetical protein KDC43_28270 [Saprospiraceae bacterium]|nr:hypothetical protein [Saprospiraceae bacterium]
MSAIAQHLEAIGHQWDALAYLVDLLTGHARDLPHAHQTRVLKQLELAALTTSARAVLDQMGVRMDALQDMMDKDSILIPIESSDRRFLEEMMEDVQSGTPEGMAAYLLHKAIVEDRSNEIALELTQAEANSLKRIAAEWGVDEEIAAGRIVMEEMQRRFGMPGGSPAA